MKSPSTKQVYTYALKEFMRFSKILEYDDIPKFSTNKIQNLLENWVMSLKERNLKASTITTKLNGVELFLEMNKVVFHKRILHRLLPSDDYVPGGEVPFTTEEIQLMLVSTTKLRTKALIHFLASTGVRPSSIIDPVLRLKHVEDMPHGCKSVKVYDGSKEGYYAFLTPEASKAFDQYLNSRRLNEEVLTPESPIFPNVNENINGKKNEYMSAKSVRQLMYHMLQTAGIERVKNGNRFDKAAVYGFRKRFATKLKLNNGVNSNIAEKLMAHKKGLDGSYLKPTREECFVEFVKAIPELTISDEFRDKFKITTLENEKSEFEKLKQQVSDVQSKLQGEIEVRDAFDQLFLSGGSHDKIDKINPDILEKRGYSVLMISLGKMPKEFHMPKENLIMMSKFNRKLAEHIGTNGENLIQEGNVLKIKKH